MMTLHTGRAGRRPVMKTVLGKAGVAAMLAASLSLGACQDMQNNPKTNAGTLLGGVGGAVVGAQFGQGTGRVAATAAGALIGAFLGNQVGQSLDRADRMYAQRAEQQAYAAPIGETIHWNNPDSGNSGTFTPVNDGRASSGAYCREYQSTINIGGREERAYGTACQQPDGSWKIVQ